MKTILLKDIETLSPLVENTYIEHIKTGEVGRFEALTDVSLVCFDFYDIDHLDIDPEQILVIFTKKDLIFLCEGERTLKVVNSLLKPNLSNELTLYNFFFDLIKGDSTCLEDFEEEITDIEDNLLQTNKKESASEIMSYRRKFLQLKKFYDQLNSIFEGLNENDNGLISDESLKYFEILDHRIDRLYSTVLTLRDYVTQVREAYQSQIDIEQNSLMKTFTVITSIFLPLTLIVGWYGMNLKMPEFTWDFGYLFVIGLSILCIIVCILFFKKKKWM